MTRSLRLIWRFRLRSALMLLSALLGVSGVIASVNYASGGRQKVLNQIRRMGTNVLSVQPQQSRSVGGRARTGAIVTTLLEQDYTALRRDVPAIRRSSAMANGGFLIKAGDLSKNNCPIVGAEPDYIRIKNWPVMKGDFFDAGELRRSARVAVLGHTVAHEMFGDEPAIGQRLFINRVPFEIIGVMTERGQGLDATNEDNQVYIPLSTAMHRLMNVEYYSGLLLEVDRWEDMDGAAKSVTGMLRQRHHASAKVPEDFRIWAPDPDADLSSCVSILLCGQEQSTYRPERTRRLFFSPGGMANLPPQENASRWRVVQTVVGSVGFDAFTTRYLGSDPGADATGALCELIAGPDCAA